MTTINLANLGSRGVTLTGPASQSLLGASVASAGDVNGDGIDDLLLSVRRSIAGGSTGDAVVIFGKAGGLGSINLASLAPSQGFYIRGSGALTNEKIAPGGDVNGDGIDDIIVTAGRGTTGARVHVIFGKSAGFDTVRTTELDPGDGFTIVSSPSLPIVNTSPVGDLNSDGLDDIYVTTSHARFVVFAKPGGIGTVDLSNLKAGEAATVTGHGPIKGIGTIKQAVRIGDFSGEGIDDLLLGLGSEAVVVYGRNGGTSNFLADNPSSGSFRGTAVHGGIGSEQVGELVSAAGDFNGDGRADIVVAEDGGSAAYIAFGNNSGFFVNVDWNPSLVIGGATVTSLASAGDVNGDGFDDILIGTSGAVYVVFGKNAPQFTKGGGLPDIDLSSLSDARGMKLTGVSADKVGSSLAGADVNGDGVDDLVIGAPGRDGPGTDAGAVYIVYGTLPTTGVTRIGADGDQTIRGGLGDDRLEGADGDDILVGGPGADILRGDRGQDKADYSKSNAGVDIDLTRSGAQIGGHAQGDRLASIENLTGSAFKDVLVGNGAANVINGGAGADAMRGSRGDDTYYVDRDGDKVIERSGEGTDTVRSSVTYSLPQHVENLVLGGSGAINGFGNGLANDLTGTDGRNLLNGVGGADVMRGRGGDDIYVVDHVGDQVFESNGGGRDEVRSSASHRLSEHVESLILTGTAAINGAGNGGDNRIVGNKAANSLSGGGGRDVLDGGAGADTMRGNAGHDTFVVDNVSDRVIEAADEGNDGVRTYVTYSLPDNVENLALGGAGVINGTGNALSNRLYGNAKANVLDGGGGVDTMYGGAGHDTYIVDNAKDTVVERPNEGTDSVRSSVSYAIPLHVENLVLTGTDKIDGTGNNLANRLVGNSAANLLDGVGGADFLQGRGGNDTYKVDHVGDTVAEAAGEGVDRVRSSITYTLPDHVENLVLEGTARINGYGNELANQLVGSRAANWLRGQGGNDRLLGGDGSDNLYGGSGNDILEGGDGSDRFCFDSALGRSNVDTILDFTRGKDRIQLDDAVFRELDRGSLPANAFVRGSAAESAEDRIIYDPTTGALFYDADGVGGVAAVQFATLNGSPNLTASDFIVI